MEFDIKQVYQFLIGMQVTDGSFKGNRIVFHNNIKDKPIFNFISSYIKPTVNREKWEKNNTYHTLLVRYPITDEVRKILYRIGLRNWNKEKNTYNLRSLSDDELNAFLLGVIDGDGYVSKKLHDISIYGLLHQLFEEIQQEYKRRFNINFRIRKIKRGNYRKISILEIHTRKQTKLCKLLPYKIFDYYKHTLMDKFQNRKWGNTVANKLTDEIRKKMVELYEEGYNFNEIGKELGCDRSTVRYWLIKQGILQVR